MKASATISLPEGLTPTPKPDGSVCVVVEGKVVDGVLQGTQITSMEDYMESSKHEKMEEEIPKKPKKKGKERPARVKAILGSDEDESMGY